MGNKKVKHLKDNNGSWAYRRRVPVKHQKTLGFKVWNRPCGDVSYQKAVTMVTAWAELDDEFIRRIEQDHQFAKELRRYREESNMWPHADTLVELVHVAQTSSEKLDQVEVLEANPLVSDVQSFDPLKLVTRPAEIRSLGC